MTTGLIYHDVASPETADEIGFPGPLARRYKHTPEQFEHHLDVIAGTGVTVGLIDGSAPAPDLALTFDDGGLGALYVADSLEARGWRGHFFIVTDRLGTPGFMTREQVADIAERGHLVGSHTRTHPMSMRSLGADALLDEWSASRADLAQLLGRPPAVAAVPGGSLSRNVIATAATAGYQLLLTSQPLARPRHAGAMAIRGRYTVWADTPTETVAAFVRGDPLVCGRAWAWWTTKTMAKRLAPDGYERLRRARVR
jgi:peptidoglycan/xylan/chitin deacetylase (PgdA/CDA1 family)